MHKFPPSSPNKQRPRSVCVFCGSAPGHDPRHMDLARRLGSAIATAGVRLVYGGGRVGLMGAAADAALAAGGSVFGVIPESLARAEIMHDGCPVEVTATLHDRKRRMAEESDGFIVAPGGIGTLEEAVEVLSWARLALHAKPIVFLSDTGYWEPFAALMTHQVEAGFTPADAAASIIHADTVETAVAAAIAHASPVGS